MIGASGLRARRHWTLPRFRSALSRKFEIHAGALSPQAGALGLSAAGMLGQIASDHAILAPRPARVESTFMKSAPKWSGFGAPFWLPRACSKPEPRLIWWVLLALGSAWFSPSNASTLRPEGARPPPPHLHPEIRRAKNAAARAVPIAIAAAAALAD
jgi:hypothetical protein